MRALEVKVKGDSSGIDQMMRELNQKTAHAGEQMQKAFTSIPAGIATGFAAAFSLTGIKSFIGGIIEAGDEIKSTAEQFDITTDSVQKWGKALDKAGVSQQTFFRSLETLRAKRDEARSDEKKRAPFEDLGLLNEALSGNVSDEQLLRMILKSNSRTAINELLGRGGARLKPASEDVDLMHPTFSARDIQSLDAIKNADKGFWNTLKGAGAMSVMGAALSIRGIGRLVGLVPEDPGERLGYGLTKRRADREARLDAQESERMAKARKDREDKAKAVEENIKAQDRLSKAEADHEIKMADLRRGSMDSEEQKVALTQEMLKTRRQIDDLESKGSLTPDEQEKLFSLQERQQGIRNSLFSLNREAPAKFETTPLERTGAVFGNSLLFNPLLQIGKQQLDAIRDVEKAIKDKTIFF